VIIVTVAVPLIIYGSNQAAYYARKKRQSPSPTARKAMLVAKTWTFWLIAVTFTLAACAHGMITTHMLPILIGRGFTAEMAVLGASMIGPMQVAGRVIMTIFERHVSVLAICLVSFLSIFIAGLALYYSNAIPFAIAVFVIGQGAGYGVFSIIRPTIIAQLLGRQNFGIIAGFLAIGFMLGSAVSPTIASLLWEASDYGLVILVAAFLPIVCLITLTFAWRYRVKSSDNE
jgi:predicted MFS family arabinose efflux permease